MSQYHCFYCIFWSNKCSLGEYGFFQKH